MENGTIEASNADESSSSSLSFGRIWLMTGFPYGAGMTIYFVVDALASGDDPWGAALIGCGSGVLFGLFMAFASPKDTVLTRSLGVRDLMWWIGWLVLMAGLALL